jgi:hypothetical protein
MKIRTNGKNQKVKLVFIVGSARSGSTILDNTLAQIKGFSTVGEVSFVWGRGVRKNRFCGCGRRFNKCKFWRRVFRKAYGKVEKPESKVMEEILKTISRYKIPIILKKKTPKIAWAISYLDRLYSSISEVENCDVIIDSSKWPSHGVLLSQLPSIELYVINIVRDPRAVAYSWLRKKKYEPFNKSNLYIKRQNVLKGTFEWIVWNAVCELLKGKMGNNYLFLRYEDFVEDPFDSVKKILKLVGEESKGVPLKNRTVNLGKNHSISGNPVRFKRGEVEIKLDDEWKYKLKKIDKFIVTVFTLPFIYYYGYRKLVF